MNAVTLDWLWRSSWQAAVLAAVVLLLRFSLRGHLRPNWRLALWTLVLLRLALPVLPASRLSLFRAADWVRSVLSTAPSARVPVSDVAAASPTLNAEVRYGGIELTTPTATAEPVPSASKLTSRGAVVLAWVGVALVLLAWLMIANWLFARRLRRGSRAADDRIMRLLDRCRRDLQLNRAPRLIITDAVDAPAVAGLWRPIVLLPASSVERVRDRELRLVLLHELAHVKCHDIAFDWAWAVVCAAHWFNPLVWLARGRYRADRELARDAMVLAVAGAESAEGYGRTILQLVQLARPLRLCPGLVGMADSRGKAELRRRIHMISRYPSGRRSRFTGLGLCLFVLAGCAALTDSRAADEPTKTATPDPAEQVPVVAERQNSFQEQPKPADPQDAQAMAKLDRVLPEVRFDGVPFSDAIDFLRDITQLNIFVNWKALEAAGIDRSAAVSARLTGVKASKALKVILKDLGGGVIKLDYTIDEGVVTVSTDEDLARNVMTRVYDVRDLFVTVPDFAREEEAAQTASTLPPGTQPATSGRDEIKRQLINLIQETVATESWRAKGGTIGTIQELSGQLIVTQTQENHTAIARLLEQLRGTRGVQITVGARFLLIEDALIERLSPDLRKMIKSAWDTATSPGDKPEFLTEDQAKELLDTVAASKTASTLGAPRVTLFNGQRALVLMGTSRPYVAAVSPRVDEKGKTTYEPQMKEVQTGLTLDVSATASSDFKYVTLALHPRLQRLTDVKREPAPGTTPEANVTVEHPVYVTRELRTTVAVPDGGTLLVGGFPTDQTTPEQTEGASTRQALGEPVVDRLLQPAKGYHLYMLVRPKLISQREVEQSRFPLVDTPQPTAPVSKPLR